MHVSSKFFKSKFSLSSRSSGTLGRFNFAKTRSICLLQNKYILATIKLNHLMSHLKLLTGIS
jgi:hypothetical protein